MFGILLFYYTRQPAQKLDELSELRKAAEQGDAWGQTLLGTAYRNGDGVPQNYNEAVNWYRKSADQWNAGGKTN